jgi:tRNA-specific 2-thiouridylase
LGRTPNPCIRCNRKIKFDALLKKAWDSGVKFNYFASGHYARIEYDDDKRRYLLKKAKDTKKDQSYFLFSLSQKQLSYFLSPLGSYTKERVRGMASDFGLAVSDKPESQNFIARNYSSLMTEMARPGPILDRQGNILGEHQGISFYTIGQRRGLGISAGKPLYVTAIDQKRNAIVVGTKEEVYGDELIVSRLNWIALERLGQPTKVKAKIRYRHKEAEAMISPLNKDKVHVKFKKPQMAIAPGQAAVFYNGDIMIGGGIIEKGENDEE